MQFRTPPPPPKKRRSNFQFSDPSPKCKQKQISFRFCSHSHAVLQPRPGRSVICTCSQNHFANRHQSKFLVFFFLTTRSLQFHTVFIMQIIGLFFKLSGVVKNLNINLMKLALQRTLSGEVLKTITQDFHQKLRYFIK